MGVIDSPAQSPGTINASRTKITTPYLPNPEIVQEESIYDIE